MTGRGAPPPDDDGIAEPVPDASTEATQPSYRFAHMSAGRSTAAVKGAFWSLVNSIIPTVLSIAVFVVTSRFLLPSDFGTVALALSIISFASAIAPAALGETLVQQKEIESVHLDSIFWICVASAALIYVVLLLVSPSIARALGQPAILPFIPVLGFKIFFDIIASVPGALIARSMAFHLIAFRTLVSALLSSIVCVVLLLLGYRMWALALSQMSVSFAACVATFWGARWLPGRQIQLAAVKDIVRLGLYAQGNRFMQMMNIDQLIIGTVAGPAALGIYNFSRRILQMINDLFASAFTSVSYSLFSSLQDDMAKVREAFLMATFGCALSAVPVFVGLAAIADDVIPLLFGQHWVGAIWPVRFFCVIGTMTSIGIVQGSLINSQGRNSWWFVYQLVRNVLTVASVFLLRKQGVTVIVGSIALQVVLLWPFTLLLVSRIIGLSIWVYFSQLIRPMVAYAAMVAGVAVAHYMGAGMDRFARVVLEIALGGALYTGIVLILCRDRVGVYVDVLLRMIRQRRSARPGRAAAQS